MFLGNLFAGWHLVLRHLSGERQRSRGGRDRLSIQDRRRRPLPCIVLFVHSASRFVVKRIIEQRMMELILVQIEALDYSAEPTVSGKSREGREQVFKVIEVVIMCKLRIGPFSGQVPSCSRTPIQGRVDMEQQSRIERMHKRV